MPLPSVIAIDGPAASGKTTVGRALAQRLGYRFLDTGLMYRTATLMALRRGVPLDDPAALGSLADGLRLDVVVARNGGGEAVLADGEDVTAELRTAAVDDAVSLVAQVSAVRRAMVVQQQRMASEGGIVMVGRDIGTRVLPSAMKVFLDATPEERARRRFLEQRERSASTTMEEVRTNLELRDRLDSERADSPLRAAPDATLIDTEGLGPADVVQRIVDCAKVRGPEVHGQ
ncbi:MAG: (d)CMP kinase [Dehalococcoidia bacterium]